MSPAMARIWSTCCWAGQNPRWRLPLEILNLFDSDDHDIDYYYASRLPGEPAMGIEDIHFHIFEPRQARIQASWLF